MRKEMNTEEKYKEALAHESEGNYTKAVKIYKEITVADEDPRFFIAYGLCLQKLDHWGESVKVLEKGISLKPHYCEGDARLFLAESYLKVGKTKKAIEQWKIAEKMEPEYPSYEHVQNEAKKMLAKYA